ncbi:hypothetical protein PsorP6_014989 [Peronosclerospora sorghi]|uniref:Uncharacterized protein n=1 Tax=Peronosclerospora sorghi TaxID=230839 RepID=A0ACC0VST7_9STRA|nr:hypothetical protein PsorP6_014989 [Peronosclerospora sorghi]
MSSAAPTSELELVLRVMLPADERVMLIQTSCLQTIGDLKRYILDEYARLFPHLPALSQDVRIQKRMSRALVMGLMDHRTQLREDVSHSFCGPRQKRASGERISEYGADLPGAQH